MDGWWKIKNSQGRTGYCPATIMRRTINRQTSSPTPHVDYESERSIYEELNIHKPPPRRNTIAQNYTVPRPVLVKKVGSPSEDRESVHYKAPRTENHYEVDPNLSLDDDIYENTDFDHPFDPKEGVIHRPIYQNTSFSNDDKPQKPLVSPKKQYPKLALGNSTSKPVLDKKKEAPKVPVPCPEKKKEEHTPHPKPTQEKRKVYPKIAIPPIPTIPTIPTSNSKKVSPCEQDEYINPDEFIVGEQQPPVNTTSSAAPTSDNTNVMKARLATSQSANFLERSSEEEEYIAMDPIYAPVAPDEEGGNQEKEKEKSVPTTPIKRASPLVVHKKLVESTSRLQEEKRIPKGRVLERTKSLEDLLDKKASSTPVAQKLQLGRNLPTPPVLPTANGYDHITPLKAIPPPPRRPHTTSSTSSPTQPSLSNGPGKKPEPPQKKPEPAKKIKPYNKVAVPPPPHSPLDRKPPIMSPPKQPPTKAYSFDSSPPPPYAPKAPKTYVAIESYESQAQDCLSFKAGDKCVLVRSSNGGWWYVNCGGKEGWTPKDFWEEDKRALSVALPHPPSVPPPSKPRSHTVMGDGPVPYNNERTNSFGATNESRPAQSMARPPAGRPRGPPPPKPRPPGQVSPPNSRKLDGPIPPPPPPRKESSNNLLSDYSRLEDASSTSLEDMAWFLGTMEREKADKYLMENGRQREFLVRERVNKKGYYALSIRYHYSVKHFNIDPKPDGSYAMGVMLFSSIEEVVKHYQMNSLFVHEGQPVALGQPVRQKSSKYNH